MEAIIGQMNARDIPNLVQTLVETACTSFTQLSNASSTTQAESPSLTVDPQAKLEEND